MGISRLPDGNYRADCRVGGRRVRLRVEAARVHSAVEDLISPALGESVGSVARRVEARIVALRRSPAHLRDWRHFSGLLAGIADRPLASLTAMEVWSWCARSGPQGAAKLVTRWRMLCREGVRAGIVARDVTASLLRADPPARPVEIYEVEEIVGLLETAAALDPPCVAPLALGALAGLRPAEAERIEWAAIDRARGEILVPCAKARSPRRRIVPLCPALARWLDLAGPGDGPVRPVNWRKRIVAVRRAWGGRWIHDGLRHSYASYRLALIGDAGRVAGELGHGSTAMLWRHYRATARAEDARRLFGA